MLKRSLLSDPEEITLLRSQYPKLAYDRIGYGGVELGPLFFGMPVLLDVLPRRLPADHHMQVRLQCLFDPECRREPRLAWEVYTDGREEPPERFAMGPLAYPWMRDVRRRFGHVALGHHPSGTVAVLCVHDERLVAVQREFAKVSRMFLRAQGYDPSRLTPADIETLR